MNGCRATPQQRPKVSMSDFGATPVISKRLQQHPGGSTLSAQEVGASWRQVWDSPEMLALRGDRKRFFTAAWTAFLATFGLLLTVTAFFPSVTGHRIIGSITVGFALSALYIATVLLLTALYVRRARRWDGLAARALTATISSGPEGRKLHV